MAEGWRSQGEGPEVLGPKGGRPNISRFFSPLPPHFSFFLQSLGGVLAEFWRGDPQMSTFGVLGLSCEALAASHHKGSGLQKTPPKFYEKTPKTGKKE